MATKRKTFDHRSRVGKERSARTEARILEAALGVFAEAGPDAPKIDDFVQAAGVSRGTFYNHFDSVEELLEATSEWTTRRLVEGIEVALEGLEGPALRFGVGLRLFFARAQAEPVWCRFVARVWRLGGLELPSRDLEDGLKSGVFWAPSAEAAQDLLFGGVREALFRIAGGKVPPAYGGQMTELCLQALRTDRRQIAAVMKTPLPALHAELPAEDTKVRKR
jgi:AcrR family transcriptional regulator